jgi:hypothetical protein
MNQYLSDAEEGDETTKEVPEIPMEADETTKEMPATPTSTIATDRHLARFARQSKWSERKKKLTERWQRTKKMMVYLVMTVDRRTTYDLRPAPPKTNIDALPVLVAVEDIPPFAAPRPLKGILDTSEDESLALPPARKTAKAKEPIDLEDGGGKMSPVRKPVAKRGQSGSAGGKRTRKPNRIYE